MSSRATRPADYRGSREWLGGFDDAISTAARGAPGERAAVRLPADDPRAQAVGVNPRARLPSESEREGVARQLEGEIFDLLVIGGGITGAGLAREAAHRGLSVALLEANDFAAGTSSRSTKLVHGGLRYLAQADVRLVREAARERRVIHALAPHLAEPAWMLLPARGQADWLRWRAAITLYERLGDVDRADRHRNWTRAMIDTEEPALSSGFPYATAYREYRTDDARLVLANLRSACASGARVLSHAPVTRIREESGETLSVEARCRVAGGRFRARARCVVNAAGPWVEAVRSLAGEGSRGWLRLTRGVHVALPSSRLPIRHMSMLRARDGRLMFAIPRERVVYVGTTDTVFPGEPALWPEVPREEVEYIVEALPRHFDVSPVDPTEIVAAWAGLRPLVARADRAPSQISRRDEIETGPRRLVSIAGGKLTGYRPMARKLLGHVGLVLRRSLSADLCQEPLPGGDFRISLSALASELSGSLRIDSEIALRLVRLYGSEATAVVRMGHELLAPPVPVIEGEVDWAIACEGAVHLEDVFHRRTRAGVYEPGAAKLIEPMAARMAKQLRWTDSRRRREVATVRNRMRADLAFREG